ncbi:MAG: hypothetical protein WC959_09105 [Kiritimatiellales bacterium]
MIKGEDSVDPIQGEFFASEEIGDLAEILIREAIQNSLDARVDETQIAAEIIISYRFADYSFSDLQAKGMPFEGLAPHLFSENSGLDQKNLPAPSEKIEYLTIEDFGTRGLGGNPEYDDNHSPASFEGRGLYDFFFFWRNIGRSGKKEGIGSWGLGKHVFSAASRINTYFGLTCRVEDSRKLLMGKSILKIHHRNGRKYAPYGYYGRFNNEEFFAYPLEDNQQISSFTEIFHIQRSTEPGLSVIIPFPKIGVAAPGPLVNAILRDYFYPIIRDQLRVRICYKGCDEITINFNTIKAVAREYVTSDEVLLKTLDLAIWSAQLPREDIIVLNTSDLNKSPSVTDIQIPEDVLGVIKNQLEENGKTALRIPIRVKKNDANPDRGEFDICFAQTDLTQRVPAKYIRQGIDIKRANPNKLDVGCIALIEVHDPVLGGLLRISEPPAHDRWEQCNNEDLSKQYDRGSKTIGFVKNAPHELWRLLSRKNTEQNRNFFRDIFYLNTNDIPSGKLQKSNGEKKKKELEETVDPLEPSIRMVRTEKIAGRDTGFVVLPVENATYTPKIIVIKAAYRVPSGNHFSKYSLFDFRFNKAPVKLKTNGSEIIYCENNVLKLKVINENFRIDVTGFDPNRDLVVQVVPTKEENDERQD